MNVITAELKILPKYNPIIQMQPHLSDWTAYKEWNLGKAIDTK